MNYCRILSQQNTLHNVIVVEFQVNHLVLCFEFVNIVVSD